MYTLETSKLGQTSNLIPSPCYYTKKAGLVNLIQISYAQSANVVEQRGCECLRRLKNADRQWCMVNWSNMHTQTIMYKILRAVMHAKVLSIITQLGMHVRVYTMHYWFLKVQLHTCDRPKYLNEGNIHCLYYVKRTKCIQAYYLIMVTQRC